MRLLVALSVVVAAACAPSGPPTREPDITGTVTHVSDDRTSVLVEERPQETSGSAIRPGADLVPVLPWDLTVVRESDGRVLLHERVTRLPRWLLVQRDSAGL